MYSTFVDLSSFLQFCNIPFDIILCIMIDSIELKLFVLRVCVGFIVDFMLDYEKNERNGI